MRRIEPAGRKLPKRSPVVQQRCINGKKREIEIDVAGAAIPVHTTRYGRWFTRLVVGARLMLVLMVSHMLGRHAILVPAIGRHYCP